MDFRGRALEPLHESSVRAAARRFRDLGVGTVGVCLLHAYANPAHELRAREILAEEHPECFVSLSCEVLRGSASARTGTSISQTCGITASGRLTRTV